MRILAAASLSCLVFLGGCTYTSIVGKLQSKPAPTRAPSTASSKAGAGNAAPAKAVSTSRAATPSPTETGPATAAASVARTPAPAGRPSLGIPPEQIPSPGECRLWLPDVPASRQGASGLCSLVQQRVPPGAWVLHRSPEKTNEVAVNVYRSKWPRTIAETRYFDYWTGSFLRAE